MPSGSQRLIRDRLAKFLKTYDNTISDTAGEKIATIYRRLRLSRLEEEYIAAVEELNELNQKRAHGQTRQAAGKDFLFNQVYYPQKPIASPATDPRCKKQWEQFKGTLKKAGRWAIITQKLGVGSICLIPQAVSDSFLERTLNEAQIRQWCDIVRRMNKGLDRFSEKWAGLFLYSLDTEAISVKSELPARPFHIERVEFERKKNERPDLSHLLDDSDDGYTSVVAYYEEVDIGSLDADTGTFIQWEDNLTRELEF